MWKSRETITALHKTLAAWPLSDFNNSNLEESITQQ